MSKKPLKAFKHYWIKAKNLISISIYSYWFDLNIDQRSIKTSKNNKRIYKE
jgi:hypothetical protein